MNTQFYGSKQVWKTVGESESSSVWDTCIVKNMVAFVGLHLFKAAQLIFKIDDRDQMLVSG